MSGKKQSQRNDYEWQTKFDNSWKSCLPMATGPYMPSGNNHLVIVHFPVHPVQPWNKYTISCYDCARISTLIVFSSPNPLSYGKITQPSGRSVE